MIEKVFTRLGFRITQRKLGQAVPVIGTLFGAGLNARLLSSVVDDADHTYRERFLRERYGMDREFVADGVDSESDVIDIAEILDEEVGESVADASRQDVDRRGE